jgi:hypothetical protein
MNKKDTDLDIEDAVVDQLLGEVGAAWAEDSNRSSERFLASFECALRGAATASRQKHRPSLVWKWWLAPAFAAAVCVIGLLPVFFGKPRCVGLVFFQEGDLSVHGTSGPPGNLDKGASVSTGPNGEGFLSLDGDRVNLFLNHDTDLTLKSVDIIRLEKGELWVRVDPGSGFFGIVTPHGFVHVVGTTFGVTVSLRETRVEIAAGKVKVGTEPNRTRMITPGTGASLSFSAADPVLRDSLEDITPNWAVDLFSRAAASQARAFFPSAAPRPGR